MSQDSKTHEPVNASQNPAPDAQATHSRRNIVKAGAGLLMAATASPLFGETNAGGEPNNVTNVGNAPAQGPDGPANVPVKAPLQNPLEKYPKPPFPRQQQEFPGLVSKMTPRPDHGETSYRGSGKLTGRKALVTGGDSGIGRAAAIAFAREGADVAINYLPVEQSDADEVINLVRSEGRRIVALPGDIRDEAFCNKLVDDAANGLGGLDLVVNVAGKQHAVESLTDLSSEQFDATYKTNV
jgi:hypothetical protein